jgi:hypothetical protein
MIHTTTRESVVQRQLDAYNAHDIDALMATYSEDIEMYEHPAKLLATGAVQVRERMTARLAEPNLHAKLIKRMVMGSIVIDQEILTGHFPKVQAGLSYEVVSRHLHQPVQCRHKESSQQ